MIIHHLATTPHGGAGGATAKLARQLTTPEHTHRLFSAASDPKTHPEWTPLFDRTPRSRSLRARWHRLLLSLAKRGRPASPEPLSLGHLGIAPPARHPLWNCDVLNLQWLGGSWLAFDRFASALPATLPVVWTLHDLNPVSSICHYPGSSCDQLTEGCQTCPWLGDLAGAPLLKSSLAAKTSFYREVRPWLVTICEWQDRLVRQSPLGRLAAGVRLIPNAFDRVAADARLTRAEARRRLGLPEAGRLVLVGASKLTNSRKGMDMLPEIARLLPPDWRWLTFGADAEAALPGLPATHFGMVNDPARLGAIYSAADLFLLPSREECLAQTGLEALANGTPVLTAADTGPADYVLAAQTGLLADAATPAAFATAFNRFETQSTLHQQDAVRLAFTALHAARFSAEVVSAAYLRLYSDAVSAKKASAAIATS